MTRGTPTEDHRNDSDKTLNIIRFQSSIKIELIHNFTKKLPDTNAFGREYNDFNDALDESFPNFQVR